MTRKILLIFFSFLIGVVFFELSLQTYGWFIDYRRGLTEPELENKIRILAIGESTTDAMTAPESKPWTYFLEQDLNKKYPSRKFVVINKGV